MKLSRGIYPPHANSRRIERHEYSCRVEDAENVVNDDEEYGSRADCVEIVEALVLPDFRHVRPLCFRRFRFLHVAKCSMTGACDTCFLNGLRGLGIGWKRFAF